MDNAFTQSISAPLARVGHSASAAGHWLVASAPASTVRHWWRSGQLFNVAAGLALLQQGGRATARTVRRHPLATTLIAAVGLGAGLTAWLLHRAEQRKITERATAARKRGKAATGKKRATAKRAGAVRGARKSAPRGATRGTGEVVH